PGKYRHILTTALGRLPVTPSFTFSPRIMRLHEVDQDSGVLGLLVAAGTVRSCPTQCGRRGVVFCAGFAGRAPTAGFRTAHTAADLYPRWQADRGVRSGAQQGHG